MLRYKPVRFFVILLMWSIHRSQSLSEFNQNSCHDASVTSVAGTIVRGEVSPRDKWPWLVAVFTKTDNKFICGGSLISERFVLTAAHCFHDKGVLEPMKPSNVNIYFGKWNLSNVTEPNVVLATPEEFIIHHEWNVSDTRWDADIAIVKLVDDVTFSNNIQPVCLWTSEMQPDKDDGGTVIGWGQKENERGGKHSDVSKEATIMVQSILDCYETDYLRSIISRRGLCIGGNGRGLCNRDSGGGLFTARGRKWFLRGITSVLTHKTAMECDVHALAIFTNVEKFTSWINQVLAG